jgi:nitrogen regulatory protein P-II 1
MPFFKKHPMKRIDAMIPTLRRSKVVDAILKAGATGITVAEARGKGSMPRPRVGGARGTARYVAEYNRTDKITTIVEDSKVEDIVRTIISASHTGSNGDGVIFVSPVEDAYNIRTGKRGL